MAALASSRSSACGVVSHRVSRAAVRTARHAKSAVSARPRPSAAVASAIEPLVRHADVRRPGGVPARRPPRVERRRVRVAGAQGVRALGDLALARGHHPQRRRADEEAGDREAAQRAEHDREPHRKSRLLKTNAATRRRMSAHPAHVIAAQPRYTRRFASATSPASNGRGGT